MLHHVNCYWSTSYGQTSEVQKKSFSRSSLPIRVMTNDDAPFSGFSLFAWVINEVESERKTQYWFCQWMPGGIDPVVYSTGGLIEVAGLGCTCNFCRYCKLAAYRGSGCLLHVLGVAQYKWHFPLVKQRRRLGRIQTLQIFMAAELRYITARNICI